MPPSAPVVESAPIDFRRSLLETFAINEKAINTIGIRPMEVGHLVA
jgi:hypothetical protein